MKALFTPKQHSVYTEYPVYTLIQLLSDLKCTSLLQVFRCYSWRWMRLGRGPSSSNSISSFKLCGRNVSNKWNNGSAEKWLHSYPRPLYSSWKTNPKHSSQKSAATAGQWWSLQVVLSLPHLAHWGAPRVSLPAIWRKNWALRSFTRPFSSKRNGP